MVDDAALRLRTLHPFAHDAVEIYSAERIIFGTDTVMRPGAGYRAAIKEEQSGIVDGLIISSGEKELILRGNAERLYFGKR